MNDKIKKLKEQISELQNKLTEESRKLFREESDKLFDKYDRLKSFGFRAYTPYFNDGDECVYEAHTDYPIINGHDEDYDEHNGDDEDLLALGKDHEYIMVNGRYSRVSREHDEEAAAICKEVKEFLKQFDNNFWKGLVGDHVKVTIKKGEIEVEEYDHE